MNRYLSLIALLLCATALEGCLQGPQTLALAGRNTSFAAEDHTDVLVQDFVLNTSDGMNLSAKWLVPLSATPPAHVILLHGVGGSKHDFDELARLLLVHNYSVLSLDFRGHGDSLQYQPRTFQSFGDQDYLNMIYDAQAAFDFLNKRAQEKKVFVIGASLGANVALAFSSQVTLVSGAGLLSPGFNYRGVAVDQLARQYGARPLFAAASKEDAYSYNGAQDLVNLAKQSGANATLVLYDGAGHGTQMLDSTDLPDQLIRWLDANTPMHFN